jgi:alpha-tubulin suppressor-like RCC1 family protein
MSRGTRTVSARGATITLWLAGAVLSGVSCRGNDIAEPTEPSTAAEPRPEAATTSTTALTFRQVSAGRFHTCGVTTDDRAYCWGYNQFGELGDGTTTTRLTPVPVAGTRRFRQVTTGALHSCGLTTDSLAFCWGDNSAGQLGDGTTTQYGVPRPLPVAVAGGRRLRQMQAGYMHTCALTAGSRIYCWGYNHDGQLGDGTTTDRLKPVRIASGLYFRFVSAGKHHSCALTPTNVAYCWGGNWAGQLGDSTNTNRLTPVHVATTRKFRQLDAGHYHTCAVMTTTNRAFCWGDGRGGQIGDGTRKLRFWPRAVAGGLYFGSVSASENHSCGVTTDYRAYCWGDNSTYGGLGDGTTASSTKPVAVAGGLSFDQLSAGDYHTCAKTAAGKAHCWSRNDVGMLGDGTTTIRLTPVAVAGAM